MLTVSQVSKSFKGRVAVSNLSFQVDKGKAFCLLGGNGAGKSTTINMLLGFLQSDKGELKFNEIDLYQQRVEARQHIFYLPDQISLYPEFSAVENLKYLSRLSNVSANENEILEALLEVSLDESFHSMPVSEYSKGMRQKVALALASLKNPKLLLLDEPTTGLDPIAIKEFVELVSTLKRAGTCVVMVSHDLQCAHLLADEIGILQAGVLKEQLTNHSLTLDTLEQRYFNSVN